MVPLWISRGQRVMVAKVVTVAFEGVEARRVDVEVQLTGGQVCFVLVGLGDKAVGESRERVRAAFAGLGLALPARRLVVNLAPADLPKEGSHYDLPIALAVMAAMGVIPADSLNGWAIIGELGLDGQIAPVVGALPAAVAANSMGLGLICPEASGPEAAWAGDVPILAPRSLIALINHFKGVQVLSPPVAGPMLDGPGIPDLRDVKGQEGGKRALEIAAAGGHNLCFVGPPGSGKSMLAQRLPGLLPPLSPVELLETSMVHSVAGLIAKGGLTRARPFRAPHHSASMAALTGGGIKAKPGEVSLAHNGVLFLDELPEFSVQALDSLRQPLETGEVMVARANAHIRYPARVQLIAAMNPCRCGHGGVGRGACGRAPKCQKDYQGRVSGPLMDRIDLQIEMPPVTPADLALPPPAEGSAEAAARVGRARQIQQDRAQAFFAKDETGSAMGERPDLCLNAQAQGRMLEQIAALDEPGRQLLTRAAEAGGVTARGWTRTLRLARTIADLDGSETVRRLHVAEALIYRRSPGDPGQALAQPAQASTRLTNR